LEHHLREHKEVKEIRDLREDPVQQDLPFKVMVVIKDL
jgi:hypothetical protein